MAGCAGDKAESARKTPYDGGTSGPTNVQAALDDLAAQIAVLAADLATTQAALATTQAALLTTQTSLATTQSDLADTQVDLEDTTVGLLAMIGESQTNIAVLQSRADDHETRVSTLETKTAAFSIATIDGKPSVVVSGVNLHIRSGSGATDDGGTLTGLGNLVVGYNELRGFGDVRTGSHTLVVGARNNYSSHGALVAGFLNTVSGAFSSVSGGASNTGSGVSSSVLGGINNNASGFRSSVSGGSGNFASGSYSSVSGGFNNTASGDSAAVSGGASRSATGDNDWVAGSLFQDF